MLKLEGKIVLDKETLESPNLCSKFTDEDLRKLGDWVYAGYQRDRRSRAKWERRAQAAMDLAMQVQKAKSFPWPNASNVAFPLITISVLQYHAKAYPALVKGNDLVRYRVWGQDPDGSLKAQADRVGQYMSWQLLEEDKDWATQQDRLTVNYAVVGTAFKKSYFSNAKGYVESDFVQAKDLVLNYWAKTVENCPRKTQIIPLFRNEIYERVRRGTFRDVLEEDWYREPIAPANDEVQDKVDNRQGVDKPMEADETTPYRTLEQHVNIDLDGDGYAEPMVITIEEMSHCVLRIVTRFERLNAIEKNEEDQIISIRANEHFTKYGFLPSPDGGIYDVGFGILLGPINESVNTAINQMFDAGTLQTTGGGFLGRGAKMRGGVVTVGPNQWVRVDSDGDDLRKSMVPLPKPEASPMLYQLLVLLVNYANRISGAVDITVGETPGQNTPAETSRNALQMGMKIYNAIFKRAWEAFKEELRKIYILNAENLDKTKHFGNGLQISPQDFKADPEQITPVADPNISSEELEIQKLMFLKQEAMTTQGYDLQELEMRILRALSVDAIEKLYPGPGKVPALPSPKVMVEQLKLQSKQLDLQQRQQEFILNLQEQRRVNTAKITQLMAQAENFLAGAQGEQAGHQIALFEAAIGALKAHDESLRGHIELMMKQAEQANGDSEDQRGRVQGMAGASGNGGTEMAPEQVAAGGAGQAGGGVLH